MDITSELRAQASRTTRERRADHTDELLVAAANEIEKLRNVIKVARYQLRHCETKMPHTGLKDAIRLCSSVLPEPTD